MPHLVVKMCFCPSLWPQTKLAIGHLLSVVPETSYNHGQYQHSSYNCHGNKSDHRPAGAFSNPGYLRETPCVCPLVGGRRQETTEQLTQSATMSGIQRSLVSFYQHICFYEMTVRFVLREVSGEF